MRNAIEAPKPIVREFDSPWKEALELFLRSVLQLFFPDIHRVIDWSKQYESLDKELHEIVRDAEVGKMLADKLFRVHLLDGTETWILIHVEVQSQYDTEFARRMYLYYSRITNRYNRDVVSLAILGDENENWRPTEYEKIAYGCELRFRFRHVKLIDWAGRPDELEGSSNSIAPIVLAHLQSLATHRDPVERMRAKLQLICSLYEKGLTVQEVQQQYRLIDWFLALPAELELEFRTELHAYQEKQCMPYVTSLERLAKEDGRQEGIIETLTLALELKFGLAGQALSEDLRKLKDMKKLSELQKDILSGKSLDDLQNSLSNRKLTD